MDIRILTIVFSGEIAPHEIPAFRGALAEKAGRRHVLFHNHVDSGYRYGYPLIQYKRVGRQPAVICLGEGVDEIHHFFSRPDWRLHLSGRMLEMRVDRLDLREHRLQLTPNLHRYRMHRWLGLNQENYAEYRQIADREAQRAFLTRKLTGNLLSFAKGIDWWLSPDERIEVELRSISPPKPCKLKGITLMGMPVEFETNLPLPHLIGLGKGVSKGYGVVLPATQSITQQPQPQHAP